MRVACLLHVVLFAFLGCVSNVAWIAFVDERTREFAVSVLVPLLRMAVAFSMFGFVAGVVAAILHAPHHEYRYAGRAAPLFWGLLWGALLRDPGSCGWDRRRLVRVRLLQAPAEPDDRPLGGGRSRIRRVDRQLGQPHAKSQSKKTAAPPTGNTNPAADPIR